MLILAQQTIPLLCRVSKALAITNMNKLLLSLMFLACSVQSSEDSECIHGEDIRAAAISKVLAPIVSEVKSGMKLPEALGEFKKIERHGLPEILQDDGVLYVGREGYFKGEIIGVEFTCITKRVGCSAKYSACSGMFSGGAVTCKEAELRCEIDR